MNPYEILGVARDATVQEIKTAYRVILKTLHPDTGIYDEERFLQVQEAYKLIGHPVARALYHLEEHTNNFNPIVYPKV